MNLASAPGSWLRNKSVLITGACGTVASGLLREILRHEPRVLRALDNYEHGLFQLQQHTADPERRVRWLLGDIRDPERLRRAMEDVEVVFHAAALKHVSIGEYNPFEIVQTNLVGLQNVIQVALEQNVGRVVFTSSDKAVNPTNAMGASKLMGERLVAAAAGMRGSAHTRLAAVRFGNVLGSSGSVVEVFRAQIARGGPVTLTDRRMTRFVMGLAQSVELVLKAAAMATGGELFVLKMPALRIADLAQAMIQRLAPHPDAVRIEEIGRRPGEKLYEELLREAEISRSWEDEDMIVYLGAEEDFDPNVERPYLSVMRPVERTYHSEDVRLMTLPEIEQMLEAGRLLVPFATP